MKMSLVVPGMSQVRRAPVIVQVTETTSPGQYEPVESGVITLITECDPRGDIYKTNCNQVEVYQTSS